MKEDYDINDAKDLWNDPAPHLGKEQIARAYGHFYGFVLKSRISRGVKYGTVGFVAVACCLFLGIFIGRQGKTPAPELLAAPEFVEYIAGSGEIKEVFLSDGSHVFLNSQSSIVCLKKMYADTRDVFLRGEALFEVAKDTARPFIVHAAGNEIKVTGTKFNVRAFLDENGSTTTLLEGGISVRVPGQANPITMVPGTSLYVGLDHENVSLYKIDAENVVGWYKGEFNAYHLTLGQICRDLERRFAVKIMISNENIASKVFYASFVNNEDVDGILNALNVRKDFRIKKQDRYYYIY